MRTSSPGCSASSPSIVRSAKFSAVRGANAPDEELLALVLLLDTLAAPPPEEDALLPPFALLCIVSECPEFVVELTSDGMCIFSCVFDGQ